MEKKFAVLDSATSINVASVHLIWLPIRSLDSPQQIVHKIIEKQIFNFSNLFCVFLKNGFSSNALNCATDDLPLTLSDRAEVFTTDTSNYSPGVKLTVFVFDIFIRIYRLLKVKNQVLAKTLTYLFIKKRK